MDPSISRDFVYVDDCCEAFIDAAVSLTEEHFGESYNIGSGQKTTIGEFARPLQRAVRPARRARIHHAEPAMGRLRTGMPTRPRRENELGWHARTSLEDGLRATAEWLRGLESLERYQRSSKKFGPDETYSVSAIIACYKDGQAIPIMYKRLKQVFDEAEHRLRDHLRERQHPRTTARR